GDPDDGGAPGRRQEPHQPPGSSPPGRRGVRDRSPRASRGGSEGRTAKYSRGGWFLPSAESGGVTLSKLQPFLTYWSLTIAVLVIWGFSVAVAMADVKDDMLAKIRKQIGRARLRPVDPLAGRSVAETLAPAAMDERERWVFHLVSGIAISLKLNVRILVLQDSMEHYLVHFAQGKRLITYRVDKAWVADAMAGTRDQVERIYKAVEQYLRQEFLGQPIAKPAPAPAAPPAAPKPAG